MGPDGPTRCPGLDSFSALANCLLQRQRNALEAVPVRTRDSTFILFVCLVVPGRFNAFFNRLLTYTKEVKRHPVALATLTQSHLHAPATATSNVQHSTAVAPSCCALRGTRYLPELHFTTPYCSFPSCTCGPPLLPYLPYGVRRTFHTYLHYDSPLRGRSPRRPSLSIPIAFTRSGTITTTTTHTANVHTGLAAIHIACWRSFSLYVGRPPHTRQQGMHQLCPHQVQMHPSSWTRPGWLWL